MLINYKTVRFYKSQKAVSSERLQVKPKPAIILTMNTSKSVIFTAQDKLEAELAATLDTARKAEEWVNADRTGGSTTEWARITALYTKAAFYQQKLEILLQRNSR